MEKIISAAKEQSRPIIPRKGKILFKLLNNIKYGSLSVIHPDGNRSDFKGSLAGPSIELIINNWAMASAMLGSGDIGLGESYRDGLWDCDHIDALIEFGILNQKEIERVTTGSALNIAFYRFKHWLNRNSKKGSQKNIHAHYDLGNSFYDKWLDESMTYSSALFLNQGESLEDAQRNKYHRILDQLKADPGTHLLEIGCGWGAFMEEASRRGLKVTGITLSQEQFKYCQNRFKNDDDIEVMFCDYRDIEGKFDHIVSIEMFEALGREYWGTYFNKVHDLLKPYGKALIQTITMNDDDFESYCSGSDFIQQFIFPGGMLPCPKEFEKFSKEAHLIIEDAFHFGVSYADTLKEWSENYKDIESILTDYGFDEEFHRLWHFYLKYCEGGFRSGKINVCQFQLKKREEA